MEHMWSPASLSAGRMRADFKEGSDKRRPCNRAWNCSRDSETHLFAIFEIRRRFGGSQGDRGDHCSPLPKCAHNVPNSAIATPDSLLNTLSSYSWRC
jgi:hypothetical protein